MATQKYFAIHQGPCFHEWLKPRTDATAAVAGLLAFIAAGFNPWGGVHDGRATPDVRDGRARRRQQEVAV
jgi:hypothetical protein